MYLTRPTLYFMESVLNIRIPSPGSPSSSPRIELNGMKFIIILLPSSDTVKLYLTINLDTKDDFIF